jgi:hypothetical protein
MYDREAMYMEFGLQYFDFSTPQRPFAIRPYIGGINAITGESIRANENTYSDAIPTSGNTTRSRVGNAQLNEVLTAPPNRDQDYIVTDISIHDIKVHPQWLDGIPVTPRRVKQFVCVPYGSGQSVEA